MFAVDVEIADLDGDANLDLVVIHEQSDVYPEGGLSVLLGEGDGTFGTYIHRVLLPSPGMLAVGDLTGDGDPDLVIAEDLFQDQLTVLVGNGDGTFGDLLPYNDVDDPSGVAIGELDGDGVLDVAVAERAQSRVVVLSGEGDGSFSEATDVPTGTQVQSLALGDLNGDTHLDVTTTGLDSAGPNASVLLGNGDGTLDPSTRVPISSTASRVTVGDLNGDDRADLVTANPSAASLSALLNTTTPVVAGAPTVIRNATAGDGQATVSWTAPASDGGTPITGYVVTPYVGFSPRPATSFSSTATTQTITGLSNGTQYRFRVQAVNAVGTSGYSTVTNPVPRWRPPPPRRRRSCATRPRATGKRRSPGRRRPPTVGHRSPATW